MKIIKPQHAILTNIEDFPKELKTSDYDIYLIYKEFTEKKLALNLELLNSGKTIFCVDPIEGNTIEECLLQFMKKIHFKFLNYLPYRELYFPAISNWEFSYTYDNSERFGFSDYLENLVVGKINYKFCELSWIEMRREIPDELIKKYTSLSNKYFVDV